MKLFEAMLWNAVSEYSIAKILAIAGSALSIVYFWKKSGDFFVRIGIGFVNGELFFYL